MVYPVNSIPEKTDQLFDYMFSSKRGTLFASLNKPKNERTLPHDFNVQPCEI
jgi:hypothetical protein